jgi:GNAT superfamily N-acetyltransferase
MSSLAEVQFRAATPEEDHQIADHFFQLWQDNEVFAESLRPDQRQVTLQFIQQARQQLAYQAFVATVEHRVMGSAGGQLFAGLYPGVFADHFRKYGYIWGVYVEPTYRRRGIAKQLTHTVVDYLHSLGCTRVILHASPFGQPVYASLGFTAGNEMRLEL